MTKERISDEQSSADVPVDQNVTVSLGDAITFGQSLHRNGDFENAENVYRQILDAMPGQVETQHFLGVLLHQMGQSEEGEKLILAALKTNPNYVDALSNLGNIYRQTKRYKESADLYRQAIALKPDFTEAQLNLAALYYESGQFDEAVAESEAAMKLSPELRDAHANTDTFDERMAGHEAASDADTRAMGRKQLVRVYETVARSMMSLGRTEQAMVFFRRWQHVEPDNPVPKHHLAALTGIDVPLRSSEEYVKVLFDGFAEIFDSNMEKLEYSAHTRVIEAVTSEFGEARANLSILDAGCGTGLCAEGIRPFAQRLTGVDLSKKMLEKARERGLYDELIEADLTEYLLRSPTLFDVIILADTLLYFGELSDVMTSAAGALRPEGRIVFTLESATEEEAAGGFRLQGNGRYRHARTHVLKVMEQADLQMVSLRECFIRKEGSLNVMGWLVVGRK